MSKEEELRLSVASDGAWLPRETGLLAESLSSSLDWGGPCLASTLVVTKRAEGWG